MKSNFHTHTKRCCHAFGVEADYAKEAYDKGLSVLGFSDHAPFKDIDYGYRMQFFLLCGFHDRSFVKEDFPCMSSCE